MNKNIIILKRKKLPLIIASLLSAGMVSAPLLAQSADEELEEITVTGSRIRAVDGMTAPRRSQQ
jgi:hypothetical protein